MAVVDRTPSPPPRARGAGGAGPSSAAGGGDDDVIFVGERVGAPLPAPQRRDPRDPFLEHSQDDVIFVRAVSRAPPSQPERGPQNGPRRQGDHPSAPPALVALGDRAAMMGSNELTTRIRRTGYGRDTLTSMARSLGFSLREFMCIPGGGGEVWSRFMMILDSLAGPGDRPSRRSGAGTASEPRLARSRYGDARLQRELERALDNNDYDAVLRLTEQMNRRGGAGAAPKRARGASKAMIEKETKKRKATDEDVCGEGGEKEKCVICYEDFKKGSVLKELNCGHKFHSRCIDRWLQKSATCPLCMKPI